MSMIETDDKYCNINIIFALEGGAACCPCLIKSIEGDVLKVILQDMVSAPEALQSGLEVEITGLNGFGDGKSKALILSASQLPMLELRLLGGLKEGTMRSFVRVDDVMRVRHCPISREEFESNRDAYLGSSAARSATSALMQSLMNRIFQDEDKKALDEELFTLIMMMDKKLDLLLEVLCKPKGDSCVEDRVSKVNISGSGIRFYSNRPYERGQLLKLTIFLPIFPQPSISAVGEVARSEAVDKNGTKEYQVAAKFMAISEDDREEIVRYTFKRERELLRNRRYANSAD